MLKTEIGREQLGFASNNLSANFNTCSRIFIFLSSISSRRIRQHIPAETFSTKASSDTSFTLDNQSDPQI